MKEQTTTSIRTELMKSYLVEKKLVTDRELLASEMESNVTGRKLGHVLVKNGFISQDIYVDAMLQISQDGLEHEEIILAHVPTEILIETKTKISAETVKNVYISTYTNETLVRFLLEPFFPSQEIIFIESSIDAINEYLDKLGESSDEDGLTLESLLRDCVIKGVSDIHINPKPESYTILVRYLGVRTLYHEGELAEYQVITSRIKDKSRIDMAERRIPQDGGFSFEHDGRMVDMRVATVVETNGETIVMRILDPQNANKKVADLGIENVSEWLKGSSLINGINLICGATGSGKTTTLNSTVKGLDKISKAIFTAEDPVEYQISYIVQCNMNDAVGYNYPRALKAFMRSDPDIIILGEIRDEETARNAVKAAETGHLVFATIHTNSILGAFNRFRDIGVPPHELKDILRSVLCQTLVRTICFGCHGHGCPKCLNSGYAGRTIVSECHYFQSDEEIEKVLVEKKPLWQTIVQNAFLKYVNRFTNFKELDRVFGDKQTIMLTYEICRRLLKKYDLNAASRFQEFDAFSVAEVKAALSEVKPDYLEEYEHLYAELIKDNLHISEI
ncbi:GspE/PulE family protein [Vibrio splendidus]|nr:ATPase, T2SS/T4P/T4SS family [Vibrio splendidus]MCC4881500.1 Flp pilus assembly complex ATPase component TadA [Vibrio splendidus]